MIIDFHTHVFPDNIAAATIARLESSCNERAYTDGTAAGLIASMRRSGVDYSVAAPVVTNPASTPKINDFALSIHGRDGIVSLGGMHPLYEHCESELKRIKAAGLRGIKLHPQYQGMDADSPPMLRLMDMARGMGMFVLLHGGEDIAFTELHYSLPAHAARILRELPGLVLIVAHYGGHGHPRAALEHLLESGAYIDTSYSHWREGREEYERVLRAWPPERVLFGTDSPWDDQAADVEYIRGLRLPPADERLILGENARALLGL